MQAPYVRPQREELQFTYSMVLMSPSCVEELDELRHPEALYIDFKCFSVSAVRLSLIHI